MIKKEMLINVSEGEECRIALVENGRLEELYMERTSATSHVGNIYKGRVTNVEPSIQAAFIDFGLGRNGFLHISDLMPQYFGRKGEDIQESVGRKLARRDRPPIQRCLHRGDEITVQIIKEGIGTKGPTLSTYLSIPGRILVMMPGMGKLGVSRKIEDEEERRRLRQILDQLSPPRECGFIIRTAGVGKSKADIQKDLTYLTRLWQDIEKKLASGSGPMELYTEGDLVTRTVRDVFTPDIERIIVDNAAVARRVSDFVRIAMPRTKEKVELHEDPVPLFHKYGIEKEIELMYSRHVPLPSGGSLIIDSTEAVVAIDVNSGKFRDHSDAEMTAFKTDMEAADEIPRQLRLRDLGGVIICDFIDLRYERHRRELEKRLHDNLKNDRAKTKMLRMSDFGIIEMTRQRMRPSLKRSIYFDCPHCKGAGLVKTPESMALDVMRRLAIAISDQRVHRIELACNPEVAFYLQNKKRAALTNLELATRKRIIIRTDVSLGMDATHLDLYDGREGLIYLEELGMLPPTGLPHPAGKPAQQPRGRDQQRGREQRGRGDRGERGDRRDQRQQQPSRRDRDHDRDVEDERFDIENVEDAVDRREVELMAEQSNRDDSDDLLPPPAPIENDDRDEVEVFDVGAAVPDEVEERPDVVVAAEAPPALAPKPAPARPAAPLPRPAAAAPPRMPSPPPAPAPQRAPSPVPAMPPRAPAPTPATPVAPAAEAPRTGGLLFHGRRNRSRLRPGRPSPAMPAAQAPQPSQPPAMPKPVTPPAPAAVSGLVAAEVPAVVPPPAPPSIVAPQAPAAPETPVADAPDAKPKRRRGSGRSTAAKKEPAPKPAAPPKRGSRGRKPKAAPAEQSPSQEPAAAKSAGRRRPAAPADQHLAGDEPVLPQPVTRPRTYRDLDTIPDDFD